MDLFVEAHREREEEKINDWATDIIGLFVIKDSATEHPYIGCRGCNKWIGWGGEHTPDCSHEKAFLDFIESVEL